MLNAQQIFQPVYFFIVARSGKRTLLNCGAKKVQREAAHSVTVTVLKGWRAMQCPVSITLT